MYKNKLTSILRRCKKKYYSMKFKENQNSSSGTWKEINSLIGRKVKKKSVNLLELDGRQVTDPLQMANMFRDYFAGVAGQLDNAIPPSNVSPLHYMGEPSENSMFADPTTAFEVQQIISKLPNKQCGLYNVPVFIFRSLKVEIGNVIAELFNESLNNGMFPDSLKAARITPIYKSGNRASVSNYRPISSLPVLSKIFEKLMCRRLMSFINSNNILSEHQFGFRNFVGTSEAITEFLDIAFKSLDSRKLFCALFLDFSKAFDTVNHGILLEKLKHLGIRGSVCNWFGSYLSSRKLYVSIGDKVSDSADITMGVPQGSILGPILFLIYVNDMSSCSDQLKFIHFADDTTVSMSRSDAITLTTNMNEEIVKLYEWLCINRLSLNVDKTCYMLMSDMSNFGNIELNVAGDVLSRVDQTKFLGIIIDERLSFNAHANMVCRSISRSIGILRRVETLIPFTSKRSLYYALIYSRVSYGVIAWGLSRQASVDRIERLLRRAQYYVSGVERGNYLNFLSINKYFICQKMYKVLKLSRHPYFFRLLQSLAPAHDHVTRFITALNFNTPICAKSKCHKSFIYQSVKFWNELPSTVRDSVSIFIFQRRLKAHLLLSQ